MYKNNLSSCVLGYSQWVRCLDYSCSELYIARLWHQRRFYLEFQVPYNKKSFEEDGRLFNILFRDLDVGASNVGFVEVRGAEFLLML